MKWTAWTAAALICVFGMQGASPLAEQRMWTAEESFSQNSGRGVPLRGSENLDCTVTEGFQPETEQQVLSLQNQVRRASGLDALEQDADLKQAAYIRAQELAEGDYFAHTRPDGAPWHTVLREDVPAVFSCAGENLAAVAYSGAVDLGTDGAYWVNQWKNSPSHYAVMLGKEYTRAGTAVYYTKTDGVNRFYAVMLYAG